MIDFAKIGKNKKFSLDESFFADKSLFESFLIKDSTYKFLTHYIIEIPSGSKYNKSLNDYGLDESDKNDFLLSIINILGVENNYFIFDHFESTQESITDVLLDNNFNRPFLFWYVMHYKNKKEPFLPFEMFFQGLRDALCHGNLFKWNDFYLLLSTSNQNKNNLKFALAIDSIDKLDAICDFCELRIKRNKAKS